MNLYNKLFKAGAQAGLDYAAELLNNLANDAERAAAIGCLDGHQHLRAVAAAFRCAADHLLSRENPWWTNE